MPSYEAAATVGAAIATAVATMSTTTATTSNNNEDNLTTDISALRRVDSSAVNTRWVAKLLSYL